LAPRGVSGMRAEGRSRPAISDVTSEVEGFINIKETSSRRCWYSRMWDGTVVRCARVGNIQEMRAGGEALTMMAEMSRLTFGELVGNFCGGATAVWTLRTATFGIPDL
jgi:hypothetical protein